MAALETGHKVLDRRGAAAVKVKGREGGAVGVDDKEVGVLAADRAEVVQGNGDGIVAGVNVGGGRRVAAAVVWAAAGGVRHPLEQHALALPHQRQPPSNAPAAVRVRLCIHAYAAHRVDHIRLRREKGGGGDGEG